jgi:hypothetical protein
MDTILILLILALAVSAVVYKIATKIIEWLFDNRNE